MKAAHKFLSTTVSFDLTSTGERLESVQLELDQYWDLLRQRRALREFGGDPDRAQIRSRDVVERYEQ